ncbi:MAG TPA: phosphatase domain-containing protein [Pseudolysinimonas sp.]|nr:phosphatase domain-containing protein [Pseudolysinimonas sp.]
MTTSSAPLHFAARLEDRAHGLREKWGRRRGLVPTIVPFTSYGGSGWVRVLSRVVLRRASVGHPGTSMPALRGWRSFTSVPVRDAAVTVAAGGHHHEVISDRGGVVDVRIGVVLPPGWQTIRLSIGAHEVEAPVFIVDDDIRFGIVSDVDDTVMVTALPRPLLAAWNTFVVNEHARTPVAGMAVLYERLSRAHPGSPVVYLSTGAWNVAPTLTRFLSRNLYPPGPLLLTDWGPTHDAWFRSGREHKRANLRRLAEEFPQMKWLLIGDDGQHDPEIYAEFGTEHPGCVAAVAIRNLTTSEAVLAGGRNDTDPLPDPDFPWLSASDGAGLSAQLSAAHLLPE